jgi:hypothetical protein
MANGIPAYGNQTADQAERQANRTDPLAPYYTGPRNYQPPAPSRPPNPYKAQGIHAYWNAQQNQWVPVPEGPEQKRGFLDIVGEVAEAGIGGINDLLATPFSRERQQALGEGFGNALSAIPGVGQGSEWLANKTPSAVITGLNMILSGQENYGQVAGNIEQGDWKSALKNLGLGTVKTGVDAALWSSGWKPALIAGTALGVADEFVGSAPSIPDQFRQLTADRAERMAQPQAATVATPRPRTATGMAEQSTAGFTSMGQGQPYYQQSPYGSQPVLEYTDDAGRVNTWNPRMKMYEVTALAGDEEALAAKAAEANIPQLSAAEQLFYDNQLRAIEDETQAILAELGLAEQTARGRAEEETGATRRQVAGGGQNVASALAFMGLDTSPGVLGVAQEDIAGAGARQEQQIQRALADQIAQFSSQRAEQERRARAERVRIESERALAAQRLIEDKAREESELALLRGEL